MTEQPWYRRVARWARPDDGQLVAALARWALREPPPIEVDLVEAFALAADVAEMPRLTAGIYRAEDEEAARLR